MQGEAREESPAPGGPIHGAFGSVHGGPDVSNAVMATTTVEWLGESPKLEIAGILSHDDHVQEGQRFTGTPMYIVDAYKTNDGLFWTSTCVYCARPQLLAVSIPKHVRKLCDFFFQGCTSLRRVTFGASSSVKRIGVSCFNGSGVEEVSIPDSVRELCDYCFQGCTSLRRVTFGALSSVERIGVSCFKSTLVEEVSIPDSVRELCDYCFQGCRSLRRVTFGSCSSVERMGACCFEGRAVEEVSIQDSVMVA